MVAQSRSRHLLSAMAEDPVEARNLDCLVLWEGTSCSMLAVVEAVSAWAPERWSGLCCRNTLRLGEDGSYGVV